MCIWKIMITTTATSTRMMIMSTVIHMLTAMKPTSTITIMRAMAGMIMITNTTTIMGMIPMLRARLRKSKN